MSIFSLSYLQEVQKKRTNIRLSKNFFLNEMLVTSRKVDNWPDNAQVIWNLAYLCHFTLQPIRDHYGKSVNVSSGYRSPELNTMIGGSTTSQHVKGQAADFEVQGVDNREVAKYIALSCYHDQLILEFYRSSDGLHSGWVHCSLVQTGNRYQFLIAKKENKKTLYLPASLDRLRTL